jgi:hypothetical protein
VVGDQWLVASLLRFLAALMSYCLMSAPLYACYQIGQPPVVIEAVSLNGRATDHDRPYGGLRFELHRAITFNREEAQKTGLWEPKILKFATADSGGLFSFGDVPPGRYWVVVGRGSMNFAVEVVDSSGKPPFKRLWYNVFADSCEELKVEDAH